MSSWLRSLKPTSGQGKRVNIALGQDCKCILLSLPSKCELFLMFFPIMVRKECIGQISDHEVIVTFASEDATHGRQLQLDYYRLVKLVVIQCHSSEFISFFKVSSELNEDVMEIIVLLSLRSLIKVLQFMLVPLACDSFLQSALEKKYPWKGRERSKVGQKEKSGWDAGSLNATADPLGSSWSGMALQSCPELGWEDRLLYSSFDCVLDAECLGKGPNLGRGSSPQPRHFQMRPDSEDWLLAVLTAPGRRATLNQLPNGIWEPLYNVTQHSKLH